jgi:hypothetical protein
VGRFFQPWSGIPRASLRSPALLRPGIIPTLHELNVGESQHGSTKGLGFAQRLRPATLGFLSARFARSWDLRKIARKLFGSHWDEVPWSRGNVVSGFTAQAIHFFTKLHLVTSSHLHIFALS